MVQHRKFTGATFEVLAWDSHRHAYRMRHSLSGEVLVMDLGHAGGNLVGAVVTVPHADLIMGGVWFAQRCRIIKLPAVT